VCGALGADGGGYCLELDRCATAAASAGAIIEVNVPDVAGRLVRTGASWAVDEAAGSHFLVLLCVGVTILIEGLRVCKPLHVKNYDMLHLFAIMWFTPSGVALQPKRLHHAISVPWSSHRSRCILHHHDQPTVATIGNRGVVWVVHPKFRGVVQIEMGRIELLMPVLNHHSHHLLTAWCRFVFALWFIMVYGPWCNRRNQYEICF